MYFFLKFLEFIFKNIPQNVGYFIFTLFSYVAYFLSGKRKQTLKKNLSVIPGNIDINKTSLSVYKNYGHYYFDLFSRKEKLMKCVIETEEFKKNIARVIEIIGKHPLIIFSMHIGNWDFGGCYLSNLKPDKINVVVEKLSPPFYRWFTERRHRWQMKVIEAGDIKSMIKVLKNKECLVLLSDRDLNKNGYQLDFLGKKAYIPSGPANLALMTGAHMILGAMLRDKNNPKKFVPFMDIDLLNTENLTRTEENCINLTKKMVKKMEWFVSQYPEQWCMLQQFFVE